MQHLDGQTLAERLGRAPLPFDQVVRVASEIAAALDAAHHAGIVHRDLKPGNIMLTKAGAKLLDFGLAKSGSPIVATTLSAMPTTPAQMTAQGAILGTFQYVAPERAATAVPDTNPARRRSAQPLRHHGRWPALPRQLAAS
jgi:serine/threonine protein kinase